MRKIIQILSAMAHRIQRIIEVRLPMDVLYGLRTR